MSSLFTLSLTHWVAASQFLKHSMPTSTLPALLPPLPKKLCPQITTWLLCVIPSSARISPPELTFVIPFIYTAENARYHFPSSLAMAIWARLCPSDVGIKKQGTMQNPFWNKWWPQQCIDLASSGSGDSDFDMVSVATVQHSWGQKSLPQLWSSALGHNWGNVPAAYSLKAASLALLHILLLHLNLPKAIQKFL